jgi:catalase
VIDIGLASASSCTGCGDGSASGTSVRELAWTVAEISPSLVAALLDSFQPCFPEHVRGTRPIHSKGIGVAGHFVATRSATRYCTAPHFDGSTVPVVVRFSNGNGQPDPDGRLQVRGMAVKFYAGGTREPDHSLPHSDENTIAGVVRVEDLPVVPKPGCVVEETDLIAMSVPVFMAQSAERVLEFQHSYRARRVRRDSFLKRFKSLVTMSPLLPHEAGVKKSGNQGFLEWARKYTPAQGFLLENSQIRLPVSYARAVYYAVHAFEVEGADRTRRMVRFSFEPSDGVRAAGPGDPRQRPIESALWPKPQNTYGRDLNPDYLRRELRQRLAFAPSRFNLRMQIADPRDDTSDPTTVWPLSRPRVLMGTLTLTHVPDDQIAACEEISFNPGRLLPGMAASDDPVLRDRTAVYAESFRRRMAARAASGASASNGCPMRLS